MLSTRLLSRVFRVCPPAAAASSESSSRVFRGPENAPNPGTSQSQIMPRRGIFTNEHFNLKNHEEMRFNLRRVLNTQFKVQMVKNFSFNFSYREKFFLGKE